MAITQEKYDPNNPLGGIADAIADLPEIHGNATAISLLKRCALELAWIRCILADDGDLESFPRETGQRAQWISSDPPA